MLGDEGKDDDGCMFCRFIRCDSYPAILKGRMHLPSIEGYGKSGVFEVCKQLVTTVMIASIWEAACSVNGATLVAKDASQAAVQAAVNHASDGDIVRVPAGSATWSQKIKITGKGINLVGAGIGQTTITSAITTLFHNAPIFVDCSGKATRISGFSFVGGAGDQEGFVKILSSSGFRVDYCDFSNLTKRGVVAYSTATSWGVIDHCTFTKVSGTPQGVSVFGDGDAAWNRSLGLGSEISAVYVEDCVFNWPSSRDTACDIYAGGRMVFRHNVVNGEGVGCHGLDSGAYRSPVSWEFYDNVFTEGLEPVAYIFQFRGGTGVVYNNTVTSSHVGTSANILLTCYRATGTLIGHATYSQYLPWGRITGSNPYDANTDCYGYPGLDQIGAAPPTTPHNLSSVPPKNQNPPITHTTQGHQAAYAWGNTYNGNPMKMAAQRYSGAGYPDGSCGNANVASMIQEGRDFVNDVHMPGYSPLTYPHPSVGEVPAPPTNLRITH